MGTRHGFIIGRSCHEYHFCHQKSFITTSLLLSRQTCVCRDKTCLLSQQKYTCLLQQKSCHGKHTFVVTKNVFCRNKHTFVSTKKFVATKIILVADPTNDRGWGL